MKRSIVRVLLGFVAFWAGAGPCSADLLKPGDVLVSDLNLSAVFQVDPTTGNRAIFSGSGTGTGTALNSPQGIAIESSGTVLTADNGVGALFQLDPTTGNRSILSGNGVGSGQAFVLPFGVVINSGGQIFVSDAGDAAGDGFIVRIDPTTGARTLISGLGAGSGDLFGNIRGIAFGADNALVVSDLANQAIYRVDSVTGARTILSDATHGTGTDFVAPMGMTVDGAGRILVTDASSGSVFSVDPLTGNRTILSMSGIGGGPSFAIPSGIVLNSTGQILVADSGDSSVPALPTVFLVDPTNGNRSILSDASNGSGVDFQNLDLGIAVVRSVPEPSSLMLTAFAAFCVMGFRRSHKTSLPAKG